VGHGGGEVGVIECSSHGGCELTDGRAWSVPVTSTVQGTKGRGAHAVVTGPASVRAGLWRI
jgi:hypothetical protein